jgi:hypothetical protein
VGKEGRSGRADDILPEGRGELTPTVYGYRGAGYEPPPDSRSLEQRTRETRLGLLLLGSQVLVGVVAGITTWRQTHDLGYGVFAAIAGLVGSWLVGLIAISVHTRHRD